METSARRAVIEKRLRRYIHLHQHLRTRGVDHVQRAYVAHKMKHVVPASLRALDKIRQGTESVCDRCGDDISLRRLRAIPGAVFCLICQERHERVGKKL